MTEMTDIGAHHFEEHIAPAQRRFSEQDILGAAISTVMPPALFIGLNGLAVHAGHSPSLPVLAGFSDVIGVAVFFLLYPMLGLAHWLALGGGRQGRTAAHWTVGLIAALLLYPFLMAAAGIFGQALLTVLLFLLSLGTSVRLFKASRLAGLLALPVVMWSGAGAFLGIAAISGGWTPPFGPTSQQ
jgi:hypothetical protein